MALVKSDSGTPNVAGTAVSSLDLTTYTISGPTSLLIGFLAIDGAPGAVSLIWDPGATNQTMTQVSTFANTVRVFLFSLINPTVGQRILRATGIGAHNAVLGALAYSGSDVVTGINPAHVFTNSGTAPTTAPNSGSIVGTGDGATVAMVGLSGATIGSTSNQTQIYLDNTNFGSGASRAVTGGTRTHNWATTNAGPWAAIGFGVLTGTGRPAGAGGNNAKQFTGEIQTLCLSDQSVIFNASMGVT